LKKLLNHTEDEDSLIILASLREYSQANKVLTSFITAYKESPKANDGHHYLFGSFKLGGTVSGRLSSSNPNLQNQPSTGSAFAKIIKKCFVAPKNWLVVGLDFNSLEDYISALTTKDPAKLKVYEDGYCGHCLRAVAYFKEQCPELQPVPEDTRVFKVTIKSNTHYLKCGTLVSCPKRGKITIEEYFDGMENSNKQLCL
jgi:DNA polymerase-1